MKPALLLLCLLLTRSAHAVETSTTTESPAVVPPYVLGGYAEAFYQWAFALPSNHITNLRGFDDRNQSLSLSIAAVDAQWDYHQVVGRVTLQIGLTPSTYYLAEPSLAGSGGAAASGPELWKYLQQAYAGYRFEQAGGLTVVAGLILSPIGPEGIAVKDNWNWSRSNLFFGLPFYHTGVRLQYPLGEALQLNLAVLNGWNSVVDNNGEKSICAQLLWTTPEVVLSVLYFGGVERPSEAPEGRAFRHLFDAHATWSAGERLSLLAHLDLGMEPNDFGTSGWAAGALYARVLILPWLYAAVRGDAFYEKVAAGAGAIFWPVKWVASGTFTLEARPGDHASFRLEYRHDQTQGDAFFGGQVTGDGRLEPYVPNERSQDTVTLGVTAWF